MTREVVVVDGLRTPYARAGTELKDVAAEELGRIVIVELLARTEFDPKQLDHVIFGNIAQPPDAVNVARVAALKAGVPASVPAFTVNRLCGSGLESIVDAYYRIAAGDAEAIIAGGVESMSQIPLLYSHESQEVFTEVFTARDLGGRLAAASRFRPRHFKPEIGLQMGLTDAVCGLNMGDTAEVLAKENGITREAQDAFSLRSHQRVTLARKKLAEEIVPVPVPPKYESMATQDNGVRENQSMEALAKLKPYFDRKFGTVTAGNSSQITDGGAAALIMSAGAAKARGYRPMGKIRSFAFCALEPERMGLGPAVATPLALKRAGLVLAGHRPRRDQRGVCRAGAGVREGLSVGRVAREVRDRRADRRDRLGAHQRQRGSDRPRAPGGLLGQPPRDDAPAGDAPARDPVRSRHDVHRRRTGRRGRRGAVARMTAFEIQVEEDGLAVLTFDLPGEKVNKFSTAVVGELGDVLVRLTREARIRGLLVRSGKADVFIAGADVKEFSSVLPEDARTAVERVQSLFEQLANLPYPTVAAINGACLGGGTELALACDYRLMSDSKKAQIGLPEVRLGIFPAWGGCTRLPRVVGLACRARPHPDRQVARRAAREEDRARGRGGAGRDLRGVDAALRRGRSSAAASPARAASPPRSRTARWRGRRSAARPSSRRRARACSSRPAAITRRRSKPSR